MLDILSQIPLLPEPLQPNETWETLRVEERSERMGRFEFWMDMVELLSDGNFRAAAYAGIDPRGSTRNASDIAKEALEILERNNTEGAGKAGRTGTHEIHYDKSVSLQGDRNRIRREIRDFARALDVPSNVDNPQFTLAGVLTNFEESLLATSLLASEAIDRLSAPSISVGDDGGDPPPPPPGGGGYQFAEVFRLYVALAPKKGGSRGRSIRPVGANRN